MLIEAREISRVYGKASAQVRALKPTSFQIETGELVAIVGASGSGKSTLMNILGLLDRPSSGSLMIEGRDCAALADDELAQLRNQRIGFVFQSYLLLPRLNAWRNVELPLVYAGVPKAQRRRLSLGSLEKVGLLAKADRLPNQLSGGEQQRVAIARAIVSNPALLLADEPTGALDSSAGRGILDLLRNLHQQGCTVVMVTHDLNVAREARRIITMCDGEVVSDDVSPQINERLPEVTH